MSDCEIEGLASLPVDADCKTVMHRVHAFLHGELSDECADEVRKHLMACEDCMDNYDVEELISALLRRCCPQTHAPESLRLRVCSMHISYSA